MAQIFRLILVVTEVCFLILVSLAATLSNTLFFDLRVDGQDHQIFV